MTSIRPRTFSLKRELPDRSSPLFPEQIHLSLTKQVTEMVVMWVTKQPTETTICQYRCKLDSLPEDELEEEQLHFLIAEGTTKTYSVGDWTGIIHLVTLTDLKENTLYTYRVGDSKTGTWSDDYDFITRRGGTFPCTMVVFADFDTKDEISQGKTTMARLAQNISEFSMVLEFGDISYADGDQKVWDAFFNLIQPVAAHVPWMVTCGNHEKEPVYDFETFEKRFKMPGKTNFWYSFDFGFVHIIVISTEHPIDVGTDQYKWLVKDLKVANKERDYRSWLIVTGHRALIGSNKRWFFKEKSQKLRNILCPLFDLYHVDLALFGHCHAYERTHPIFNGKINPIGTIYLLAGVAGAELDKEWEPQPRWSAYRTAHHGYGLLHVKNPKKLRFCYHRRRDGKMWDAFTIRKRKNWKKQIQYDYEKKFLSKWYTLPAQDQLEGLIHITKNQSK